METSKLTEYIDFLLSLANSHCDNSQDAEYNMLKLFYLIKHNIAPETVDLDTRMLQGIPLLCKRGFLSLKQQTADNPTPPIPKLQIPCLTHEQEKVFSQICKKAANAFAESIKDPLAAYCSTHRIKIPTHLKSVPDAKLTQPYEPSPMMFVYEAIHAGLHPRNLGYPCPETIVVFD